MPTPVPALPKKWDRDEIPPQKVAEQNIKDLQTRAKLAREKGTNAKRAADLAMQKLGNFLSFDAKKNDQNKVKQAAALKPTVVKLYEDARKLSEGLSLPTGAFQVWVTGFTKPKFYHNASAAGKTAVWSYKYADTGLDSINGEFDIEMDRTYASLKGDENAQAKKISDAAVAKVKSLTKATNVKMVKSP